MSHKNNNIPKVEYPFALTIAGSDSGGGAGIQADLKAFAACGAFGLSAITAVTAQNSQAVRAVFPCGEVAVTAQIEALKEDFPLGAIKTGMLVDAATISAVVDCLQGLKAPLVVDPVMIATSGACLLDQAAVSSYAALIARATLLTPNLPEAQALLGSTEITTRAQMLSAAKALLNLGCEAVLLKGGHASGTRCADLYMCRTAYGFQHRWYVTARLQRIGHGTGCTLSASITAHLARGIPLESAVTKGISNLRRGFRNAKAIGNAQVHTPDPFFLRYR